MRHNVSSLKKSTATFVYIGILIIFVVSFLESCAAPNLNLSLKAPLEFSESVSNPTVPLVVGMDNFVDLRPQARGSDNQKWKGRNPGMETILRQYL